MSNSPTLTMGHTRAGMILGTDALRAKYKDARPADLEQRADLLPADERAVVDVVVEGGVDLRDASWAFP
jgi:hypothetical protein